MVLNEKPGFCLLNEAHEVEGRPSFISVSVIGCSDKKQLRGERGDSRVQSAIVGKSQQLERDTW